MTSQGWTFSRLETELRQSLRLRTEVRPPCRPYFQPRAAIARRSSVSQSQNPLSFLRIPTEIRDQIWECIFSDIRASPKQAWYAKPATDYDALPLVCRQIYFEISHFWRRSIIPQHRLNDFLSQKFSLSKLHDFKSLTIEIPFNMSLEFFSQMASMLRYISPFLEHFNLYFTGSDAYGTKTFIHGCGNQTTDPDLAKLPADGQGFEERHIMINALSSLQNLRSLAIINPNMPLLQSHILAHKRRLKKLHIECDSRSTIHIPWKAKNCGHGLLVPVTQNLPPVRELYISANAAILSVQVVSKLDLHLKKLTWVCPDVSRQTGSMQQDYFRDTAIILSNLRSNSRKLQSLRICIEGAIYENLQAYGTLIGAFRSHPPHLDTLRNLELHLCSKSPWMGKELVQALPSQLERLYLGDRLINLDDLLYEIAKRYLKSHRPRQLKSIVTQKELSRDDYISFDFGSLTFVNYQYEAGNGIRYKVAEFQDTMLDTGTPAKSHDNETDTAADDDTRSLVANYDEGGCDVTLSVAEYRRFSLLKLNGRLLDRARNRHLTPYPLGRHIPCPSVDDVRGDLAASSDSTNSRCDVSESKSHHPEIDEAVKKLKAPAQREIWQNNTFLRMSVFTEDPEYFGNEAAAQRVFDSEKVARIEDLEARTYPMEVEVGAKEHWMCELA